MPINRAGPTSPSESPTAPTILLANTARVATFSCFRSNIHVLGVWDSSSSLTRSELSYFARLAQHLIYFAEMLFFFCNHFPRIFLEQHGPIAHEVEEFFIKRQACFFCFERFEQNVINAMLMSFEKGANLQRRVFAKVCDQLACFVGMH